MDMRAAIFDGKNLRMRVVEGPVPRKNEVLVKVLACGICRTDLHILDGELQGSKLPLIPGHQVVGVVKGFGEDVEGFERGKKVGVPWLGYADGTCEYCLSGRENLCESAEFTGYTRDGGYAEYCVADARFCFPLPDDVDPAKTAPLLCAGLIGYRAWRKCNPFKNIGFYGFGNAARILIQIAEGKKIYAFTRPGDEKGQKQARDMGAVWAGGSDELPGAKLDAAIIFASAGELVPIALKTVKPGGTVVCAGIHMSDIPEFPYDILWGERTLTSVANLTREDGSFLRYAGKIDIPIETFLLEDAAKAVDAFRGKRNPVLVMDGRRTGTHSLDKE